MTQVELPDPLQPYEPGMTTDTGEMFIGTPDLPQAQARLSYPYANTQILTEFSDNCDLVSYQYLLRAPDGTPQAESLDSQGTPILRRLQDRLDEVVSVKAYGAQGTNLVNPGDVTIETKAIQKAAIDVASQGGIKRSRTLYFPAGVYTMNGPAVIPDGAQWMGDGKGKTIIFVVDAGIDSVAETIDASVTVDDVDNDNLTPFLRYGITTPLSRVHISGITFMHVGNKDVLRLFRTSYSSFTDCAFIANAPCGIKVAGSLYDAMQDSIAITIDGLGTVTQPTSIHFSDCEIMGATYGTVLTDDISGLTFSQCGFHQLFAGVMLGQPIGAGQQGYHTLNPNGPRGVMLSQNMFENIATYGIGVWTSGNSTSLNVFKNVGDNLDLTCYPTATPTAPNIFFAQPSTLNMAIGDSFNIRPYMAGDQTTHYIYRDPGSVNNLIVSAYPFV